MRRAWPARARPGRSGRARVARALAAAQGAPHAASVGHCDQRFNIDLFEGAGGAGGALVQARAGYGFSSIVR